MLIPVSTLLIADRPCLGVGMMPWLIRANQLSFTPWLKLYHTSTDNYPNCVVDIDLVPEYLKILPAVFLLATSKDYH